MGQVRTHAFFDADSSATANKCTLGSKPWIYSKNGISCSKTVPSHSNKSCSPSTNLYARKCFSLPGWLPGFAAQYTRTLVYLLLKKTLVCCEDIILIDRFSTFRQSWKLNLHGPTIQSTMCIQLAFCAIQAFLSQFHRCLNVGLHQNSSHYPNQASKTTYLRQYEEFVCKNRLTPSLKLINQH